MYGNESFRIGSILQRSVVDTIMEEEGDTILLTTRMMRRIDKVSLNHLRAYHLRSERDEHGKVVCVSYVPECMY